MPHPYRAPRKPAYPGGLVVALALIPEATAFSTIAGAEATVMVPMRPVNMRVMSTHWALAGRS